MRRVRSNAQASTIRCNRSLHEPLWGAGILCPHKFPAADSERPEWRKRD